MSAPNLGRVQRQLLLDLHKRNGLSATEMHPHHGSAKQCAQLVESLEIRGFIVAYFDRITSTNNASGKGWVYRITVTGLEALRYYGDIPAKKVDSTVGERMARMRDRKREAGLVQVTTWVPAYRKAYLLDLAQDWCDNPPAWVPCDHCGEFLCTIHGGHASDCDCAPIDELDFNPYQESFRPAPPG